MVLTGLKPGLAEAKACSKSHSANPEDGLAAAFPERFACATTTWRNKGHSGAVARKPSSALAWQIARAASLSCRRNASASGPNSMDSGTATAPICRTAM